MYYLLFHKKQNANSWKEEEEIAKNDTCLETVLLHVCPEKTAGIKRKSTPEY